jgi:hypothetical protein
VLIVEKRSRIHLVGPLAALALTIACAGVGGEPRDSRTPRLVLLFSFDTLRADRVTAENMPTLFALGQAGVCFRRAYSQSAWTRPSHYSLLASRYPDLGMVTFEDRNVTCRISEREVLLPEVFRRARFATAAFTGGGYLGTGSGFEQGFDRFESHSTFAGAVPAIVGRIERTKAERSFLFVHHFDVHVPYRPPPVAAREHLAGIPDSCWGVSFNATDFAVGKAQGCLQDPGGLDYLRDLYSAEAWFADRQLERILAAVRDSGRWGETLVVILSDHGEGLYAHGRREHTRTLDEEIVNVPLILAGAGVPEGIVIDEPVELRDVAPTILALVGLSQPASFQGNALQELWLGGPAPSNRTVFSISAWLPNSNERASLPAQDAVQGGASMIASVIRGREKVVRTEFGSSAHTEYRDLGADPDEQQPREIVPGGPGEELAELLRGWVESIPNGGSCTEITPDSETV